LTSHGWSEYYVAGLQDVFESPQRSALTKSGRDFFRLEVEATNAFEKDNHHWLFLIRNFCDTDSRWIRADAGSRRRCSSLSFT
jgi:hypothetical protein